MKKNNIDFEAMDKKATEAENAVIREKKEAEEYEKTMMEDEDLSFDYLPPLIPQGRLMCYSTEFIHQLCAEVRELKKENEELKMKLTEKNS
jgi:hypothetical protein